MISLSHSAEKIPGGRLLMLEYLPVLVIDCTLTKLYRTRKTNEVLFSVVFSRNFFPLFSQIIFEMRN